LSELLLEQHGVDAAFDGFMTAPGLNAGSGVTSDGILEMTGAAYWFGPQYSLWPFHAKLAPGPRESTLCLSTRSAIVAMGEPAVPRRGSRETRAPTDRARERARSVGAKVRVPPDPLGWPYVMHTALPVVPVGRSESPISETD